METKNRLGGMVLGAILTAVVGLTAYNAKPIAQAFNEGNMQYGEMVKELSDAGEMYMPLVK